MTITLPFRRLRSVWYIFISNLLVVLSLAWTTPSRADILDCIKAVAPIEQGLAAAELAAKFSACGSQLVGGDPVMAAAVAAMAALVASGEVPLDADLCEAEVNGLIGEVVAKTLVDSGVAGEFLGDDIEAALMQVISGAATLDQIPALSFLSHYLNCGCTIVTAPGEAAKIAEEYMSNVKGCADFFSDVGGEILNWLEDFAGVVIPFAGAAGGGDDTTYCSFPYQFDKAPPGGVCPDGAQCSSCGGRTVWSWCGFVPQGINVSKGLCGCKPGYEAGYDPNYTSWLLACKCDPPMMRSGTAVEECLCPAGQQMQGGACVACSDFQKYTPAVIATNEAGTYVLHQPKCTPCSLGYKASPDHSSCIPACNPGWVFDVGAPGYCRQCDANMQAVYTGGLGSCQTCPAGTSSPPGSTECSPLDCGNRGYQDVGESPNACIFCPSNQIYIVPTIISKPSATGGDKSVVKKAGYCGCGDNQRLEGDNCVCPEFSRIETTPNSFTCSCPLGAHVDEKTFACTCPAGAKLDPATFGSKCICPSGQRLEGENCVSVMKKMPPPTGGLKKREAPASERKRKDCSALGSLYINHSSDQNRCVKCPAGTKPNPSRTDCVPVRAPKIQPQPINCSALGPKFINNPRDPAKCIRCGKGLVANEARTACVPVVKQPRAEPPIRFKDPVAPKPLRPQKRRDCSALGDDMISNPRNPTLCIRCKAGWIANEAHTQCINPRALPKIRMRTLNP